MADQDGILSIADARRAGEGDAPQIATSLQQERFQAAATAVVTELANTLGGERASICFMKAYGLFVGSAATQHCAYPRSTVRRPRSDLRWTRIGW